MTDQPRSAELAAQIKREAAQVAAEQAQWQRVGRGIAARQRNLALLRKERKLVLAAERRGKE